MNQDTGRIYEGDAEIEAAKARGERLIELSPRIRRELMTADAVSAPNREQRRAMRFGRKVKR